MLSKTPFNYLVTMGSAYTTLNDTVNQRIPQYLSGI
jgi:hypothetical protein